MKGIRLASVVAALLLLFSSGAQAEFGAPYVTPSAPTAGEILFVNVPVYQIESCDALLSAPGYPRITQEGNEITYAFFGTRYESMDTCAYMPGVATRSFGAFPAGAYVLTVKLNYFSGGGDPASDTLGLVPLVVAPARADAVAVPSGNSRAAIICAVALSFLGVLALRRRRGFWFVLALSLLPMTGHSEDSGERSSRASEHGPRRPFAMRNRGGGLLPIRMVVYSEWHIVVLDAKARERRRIGPTWCRPVRSHGVAVDHALL